MSADAVTLIKIKTILETQGIDAAKAKITELTNSQSASTLSEAVANAERQKSVTQAEKTARAILAMNNAMASGMGPFRAAISVANQLGGEFALLAFRVSAIGTAMAIGWKIGDTIRRNLIDPLTEVRTGNYLPEIMADIDKLNNAKLDKLKKEVDSIKDSLSNSLTGLDDIAKRTEVIRGAIADRLSAEAAATPEGPERDRAVNEEALRSEQEKYIITRQQLGDKKRLLKTVRGSIENEMLTPAKKEMDEAEKQWNETRDRSPEAKAVARVNYFAARERFDTAKEGLQPIIDSKIEKMTRDVDAELTANEERMKSARVRYETTIKSIAEGEKRATELKQKEQAEAEKKQQVELRTVRLASLKESFTKEKDPKKLIEMSEEMAALQIAGLSEGNPEAKALHRTLIIKESQKNLTDRLGDIEEPKAEAQLKHAQADYQMYPHRRGALADVKQAEAVMDALKSGNEDIIARFAGIASTILKDQKEMEGRLRDMETRQAVAPGLN